MIPHTYSDTNRKTIYLRVKTNICTGEIGCLKFVAFFLKLEASLVNKNVPLTFDRIGKTSLGSFSGQGRDCRTPPFQFYPHLMDESRFL